WRDSWLEERSEEQHSNTVLHMAAKLGYGELVSKIIELRPSLINSRNAYGNKPLHLAALLGDVNIVTQMLAIGSEACSARNNKDQTPLHLACRSISMEAARLLAEKTKPVGIDELNFAISTGSICIAEIILERFPYLAREEAWVVEGGSLSTLLHHACDRGDLELTRLDQRLEEALNRNGLSPLHLAVLRGSVGILWEFLDKAPLSFGALTPSKETVFHLAARSKNIDAFVFMAESVGINSQFLLQQTDENGNTVLHIAASMACGAPLIRYIVEELDSEKSEEHYGHSNSFHKESLRRNNSLDLYSGKMRSKEREEERAHALQNARNTIAIVAVLIASVAYAGGINPPGGVYQDWPWRGKSLVGKTTAFKVFAICNNIALVTSLCIVILLVSIIPYKRKPLRKLLVATHRLMWVSIGFMATAYIAASWVTIPHYDGTRWLFPAIISVAGGALTVLFSYLRVETIGHWFRKMNHVEDIPSFARNCKDLAASGKSGYFTY
ncbi:unnamed protein product, partial [Thlaspi arvense]